MIFEYHSSYKIPVRMASEAADEQVHAQAKSTNSMKAPLINENGITTSLPSPPSSVKATGSDSGRNENDSHSAEVAGCEPSVGGSSASASIEASAGIKNTATLGRLQANRWNS